MWTLREAVGAASVIVGVAVLAAVNHHPTHGRRTERERAAVQAAADQLSYQQISDAWTQIKLGHAGPVNDIRHGIPLRYRSTHQEDGAIILTFAGHNGRCIDLVSRPTINAVETRRC